MQKQIERTHSQVGWGFWLWWVLASTVGFFVVGVVSLAFGFFFLGLAVVTGPMVGALQWLVLRGKISQAGRWVSASIVGVVVGFFVGAVVVFSVSRLVGFLLGGATIGALQWLVLREKISQAGWWVPASTIGWVIAWIGGFFVTRLVGTVAGIV